MRTGQHARDWRCICEHQLCIMLRRSIPLLARSVRTHIPTATTYIRTMSSAVPKTMKAVQVSCLVGEEVR